MSQILLVTHLLGAFLALIVAVFAVRFAVRKDSRSISCSRLLSFTYILNSLSGLLLAISTSTSVFSICDNLAFYTIFFVCVHGFVFSRMRLERMRVSLSPIFFGVGTTGVLTVCALIIGF